MRRAVSWAGWWFVLFWAWLFYNGAWPQDDLIAAACAAAIGAIAAEVVRRCAGRRLRFQAQHLRRLWRPLWEIFPQFGLVVAHALTLPLRPHRGAFVEEPAGGRAGTDDPAGRAERVFVVYTDALSANDYVVEVERERKLALRHVLVRDRLSRLP